MTAGTKTIGSLYSPYFFSKTWSGANGKHEIVAGKPRDKWNTYDMTLSGPNFSKAGSGGGYIAGGSQNLPTNSRNAARRLNFRAQAKLADRVRGDAPNLAVDIAQGRQTMQMVYGALSSFSRCAIALRRGDFVKAARSLGVNPRASRLRVNDVAGRWLELQYGWLPTLSDIFALCELWEAQSSAPQKFTYVARAKEVLLQESSVSPSFYSVPAQSKVRCRIEAELTENVSLQRSLGLYDPLSILWEILPWSFVIDWFLPIGTWLDAGNIIPQLTGRFLTTYSYDYTYSGVQSKTSGPVSTRGASTAGHGTWVERRVSTNLKVPPPEFQPLNEALSPKRFYNAIALATQAFSSPERIRSSKTLSKRRPSRDSTWDMLDPSYFR